MMQLTKGETVFLRLAVSLGGTVKVYPDQWSIASRLEAKGLVAGNGKHIGREATITEHGRKSLSVSRNETQGVEK